MEIFVIFFASILLYDISTIIKWNNLSRRMRAEDDKFRSYYDKEIRHG